MAKVLVFAFIAFFSTMYWRFSGVVLKHISGSDAFSPVAADEARRQPWMLAFLVIITACSAAFFRIKESSGQNAGRSAAGTAAFFTWVAQGLVVIMVILFGAPDKFPWGLYYTLTWLLTIFFAALIFVKNPRPGLYVAAGFSAYIIFAIFYMLIPPNTFSDMLPLIQRAGLSFIHGGHPNAVQYDLGVPNSPTYLPGMWLSFLPFTAAGFDLRLMNFIFMALFVFFAWRAGRQKGTPAEALLMVFLANPWLTFRYDLYLPAYLWVMALFAWATVEKRDNIAAIAFGWSCAVYQFSWILWPAWIIWKWRTSGRGAAVRAAAISAAIACCIILPFVIKDPALFYEAVFGHWKNNPDTGHYNLVTWLPYFILVPLQVAGIIAGMAMAWKIKNNNRTLFAAFAVIIGVFITANHYGTHYFFQMFILNLMFSETT